MQTNSRVTFLMAGVLALTVSACDEGQKIDDGGVQVPDISKEEAARTGGKSDSGLDYCDFFGWYGDQICDTFCAKPDPDCRGLETFESFRASTSGFCPQDVDCSSFIELHADGTLLVDRANELPARVYEAKVSDEDMEKAVSLLTDETLIELLAADEPPCVEPQGVTEFMTLETNLFKYFNPTTFCDKEPLPSVRDFLQDLADTYVGGDTEPTFESFRTSTNGFCPPEVDCNSFTEIKSDGTLRIDLPNDLSFEVHELTLLDEDLAEAIDVLTDPALIELLDKDEACPQPTDLSESMTLVLDDGEHRALTTFCDDAPLQAVRELMNDIKSRYISDPINDFVRFRLSKSAGPCPPEMDCSGHIELFADGTLRVDIFGEQPAEIHEATVTDEELLDAIEVLADDALYELLTNDDQICEPPSDIFEFMELEIGAKTVSNSTTFCDNAPLQAARDILFGLQDAYFPQGD